jgi:hypothetical protein
MFGFFNERKRIKVQFFEVGADKPFAQSDVPVDQLPDTFEIDTTLHLGSDDWSVSKAIPPTKSEFRKSGKVSVYLYKPKITNVPISELLYSLPTISDLLPDLVATNSLEDVVVLHEDDWRQVELISADQIKRVHQEISSIREIHEKHRVESGFKSLHVRKLITTPLAAATISLQELKKHFGVGHEYAGVAFNRTAAVIRNGFAFRASNSWLFWGQMTKNGTLSIVCIRADGEPSPIASRDLESFLFTHRLLFVDWARLDVVPGVRK